MTDAAEVDRLRASLSGAPAPALGELLDRYVCAELEEAEAARLGKVDRRYSVNRREARAALDAKFATLTRSLEAATARADRAEAAAQGWCCFHCDKVFTEVKSAAEHFGATPVARTACQQELDGLRAEIDRLVRDAALRARAALSSTPPAATETNA